MSGGGFSAGGGAGRGSGTGTNEKREVVSPIQWQEVQLQPAAAITPKEGEKAGKTGDEQLAETLRIHRMDPRPTLLYFHHEHEDIEKPDAAGRATKKLCEMLADDAFTRWGLLIKCVEVNVAKSDAKLIQRLGAGEGPSFAILDHKLEVVAKSGAFATPKLAGIFVRDAVTTSFPNYWKELNRRIEEQRKVVAEARALVKEKKLEDALTRFDSVIFSDVRVGDFFDDICREADTVAVAIEKARKKELK